MGWLPMFVDLTGSAPDRTGSSLDLTGLYDSQQIRQFCYQEFSTSADTACSSVMQNTTTEQKDTTTYPSLEQLNQLT